MKKYELQTFQLIVGLFMVFLVVRAVSAGISGTRGPDIPIKQASHDNHHGHDDHGHDDHGHDDHGHDDHGHDDHGHSGGH